MAVEGRVAAGLEAVRDEFERNFIERGEVGAAFCVYRDGEPVVDLWGGVADADTGRLWAEDTVCRIDSTTKGLTAACALQQVELGVLQLDAPIADYWPDFGANGKEAITLRQVLSHQAGIPAVDQWLSLADMVAWEPCIRALEAQRPYWQPGTAHGYHAFTFGWIVGEVLRRTTGLTVGQYLEKHITSPLGLELWIGLPERELARVAPTRYPTPEEMAAAPSGNAGFDELTAYLTEHNTADAAVPQAEGILPVLQAVTQTDVGWAEMNRPEALTAEIPAAGGVGTARSHARFYAALVGHVDGVRLLGPDIVEEAATCHRLGPDQIAMLKTAWGLGFQVPGGDMMFPAYGPRIFGHSGANGTIAFADRDRNLSVAYARNQMLWAFEDPRSRPLIQTVYACLS